MADVKITALPDATTPLAGTEVFEVVQSSTSRKVAASVIAAAYSTDPANILPATAGGTGFASYAVGDILYASTTTALSKLADVATGNALISGGVGVAPSWGKIGLTTHVSGTLPTANGGTNLTSFTSGGAVYATSTSVLATGTLPATAGGTDQASYAVGDLLYASSTTALSKLADVATGNALISGGVSTAPSWGKVGLTTHVSGTLPTANGGTNLTSFTSGGAVYATSTSVLTTGTLPVTAGGTGVGTLTSGYLVRGAGTSAVVASVVYDDGSNIGIGTASPSASAILDVQSTTKGFRLPNMTTTQKNNIVSPAAGLMLFDTTLGKACVYTGSAWQTITSA